MSRDVREEVEALPWPEVICEGDPSTAELLLARVGELTAERDALRGRCERLEGRVEHWRRRAGSWRFLATLVSVGTFVAGAVRLLLS